MSRVVILGATGFVGRNVARYLAEDPAFDIVAVRNIRPAWEHPRVRWVQADLTREGDVERAVDGAEMVVHAAAATAGAAAHLADPLSLIVDNQVMNARIFATAHRRNVRHVLWYSCSIMYASKDRPQTEADFDPAAPLHKAYVGAGTTKVYFERMCAWYAGLGRTRFTVFRHSNVYGPHDKYDLGRSHMFGATLTKALTAREGKLVLWGTGTEGRDLIHADDLARATKAALTRQTKPYELFNIGSGEALPVSDIARRIVRGTGRDLAIETDPAKPSIPVTIALDCAKARAELGWAPQVGLDEGIARTIAWWRENRPTGEAPA
jgi:GDP-L-fucose synthase